MENGIPDKIVVAVDTIILAIGQSGLEVMLVQLKNKPYEKMWALPGAVVGVFESLEETAKRILVKRVGDSRLHLEQLYCFGNPNRDARGRSISVAYFVLLSNKEKVNSHLTEQYLDMKWFNVNNLPEMAFDHREIVKVAMEKLAYKLDEIEIIRPLLPTKFTLSELQRVYEILSGKKIDKRNFIKKVKNDEMVVPTMEMKTGEAYRPAKLFRFK